MNITNQLESFSSRLKALRKKKRVKQTEMASIVGCTWSHYQKIEYGQINIHVTTLMILADYFGVTTDYLLGRSDESEPVDEKSRPEKPDGEN